MARVWLARRQMVPVLLTSVGILVTVERTGILGKRERDASNTSGMEGIELSRFMLSGPGI